MVALVLVESSCIKRYKQDKADRCNHGDARFWHHGTHTMVQTCPITSHEHNESISSYQNITKLKM